VPGTVVRTQVLGEEIYFFVANPTDTIGHFHYEGRFYEEEELEIISRFYRGGVFVDVGGNVGNHSIYVEKILKGSKVIVFEPNPTAIVLLRINLRLNACTGVDTRYLGLALADGCRVFKAETPKPTNLGHTRLVPGEDGTIRSIRGDSVLGATKVEFIKIDVEGMELEILEGLRSTINRYKPNLFIEVWEHEIEKFLRWCRGAKYQVAEQFCRYEGIQNYLIVPNPSV
jgi:FkbM family methyltransferase